MIDIVLMEGWILVPTQIYLQENLKEMVHRWLQFYFFNDKYIHRRENLGFSFEHVMRITQQYFQEGLNVEEFENMDGINSLNQ